MEISQPRTELPERSEGIFEIVSFIAALMWSGSLLLTIARPKPGMYLTIIVLIGLSWLTLWLAQQREELARPRLAAVATFLFLTATIGALSFTSSRTAQMLIAISSGIVFYLSLRHFHRTKEPIFRGRVAAFMMTFAVAGVWYTLLSANVLVVLSWWWLVLVMGAMGVAIAVIVWRESALPWPLVRMGLAPMAVVAMEAMLVTWWLPTVPLVGTIVGTTFLMLVLQFARHYFKGDWTPGRGRRYVLIGSIICIIVLASARWM